MTVFCSVTIIVFGITFLTQATPGSIATSIGEDIATNNLSLTGSITSGSWLGSIIDIAHGGTGLDLSAIVKGSIPFFSNTGVLSTLNPGTSGQVLTSGGNGADPSWENVTRSATFVIAASDSAPASKKQADYVCDGSNDLEIINTALASAAGGSVFLHAGTYTKINLTEISIPSNTALIMASNAILKFGNGLTGANPAMISCSYVENVTIQGGIIDGNKTNQATTGIAAMGIKFIGVSDSRISNVLIKNIGTPESLSGYGIYLNTSSYNVIDSCVISGCKRENLVLFSSSNYNTVSKIKSTDSEDRGFVIHRGEYNVISECVSYNDTNGGIQLQPYDDRKARGNIITNNVINTTANGILFNGQSGGECMGNYVYNATTEGIQVSSEDENCIISNNTIDSCTTGIGIYDGLNNHIVGNTVVNSTGILSTKTAGIMCASSNISISENTISNGAGVGILLYSSSQKSNISVKNNNIVGSGGSGIFVRGVLSDVFIESNYLRDNAKSAEAGFINGITLYGTNDRVFINRNSIYGGSAQLFGIRIHSTASLNTNVFIRDNILDDSGLDGKVRDNTNSATFFNNTGYTTENSGTSTITAGQTSVTVTHGLAATPTRVQVTPTTATGGKDYYISAKTATTFTIDIDSAHTGDISFDWRATVGEGN